LTKKKWVYEGVEFSVGDRVLVVRFAEKNEADGMGHGIPWDNTWIDGDMDDSIGHEFTILDIDYTGVRFCETEGEYIEPGYGYPLSCLEKVGQ